MAHSISDTIFPGKTVMQEVTLKFYDNNNTLQKVKLISLQGLIAACTLLQIKGITKAWLMKKGAQEAKEIDPKLFTKQQKTHVQIASHVRTCEHCGKLEFSVHIKCRLNA